MSSRPIPNERVEPPRDEGPAAEGLAACCWRAKNLSVASSAMPPVIVDDLVPGSRDSVCAAAKFSSDFRCGAPLLLNDLLLVPFAVV